MRRSFGMTEWDVGSRHPAPAQFAGEGPGVRGPRVARRRKTFRLPDPFDAPLPGRGPASYRLSFARYLLRKWLTLGAITTWQ